MAPDEATKTKPLSSHDIEPSNSSPHLHQATAACPSRMPALRVMAERDASAPTLLA
jgi:hypothetical protein